MWAALRNSYIAIGISNQSIIYPLDGNVMPDKCVFARGMRENSGVVPGVECRNAGRSSLAQYDANVVDGAIVGKWNIRSTGQQLPVQLCNCDATCHAGRIVHFYLVNGRVIAELDGIGRPISRYARIDGEHHAAQAKAKDPLHTS